MLVPEDRKRAGLIMTGSVGFNLALPWTRQWNRGCRVNRVRRAEIVGRADAAAERETGGEEKGGDFHGGEVGSKWSKCAVVGKREWR